MDHYIVSECISFVIFFCIGIGISLQPGAVMAGVHISAPLRGDGKRWIAFVIMSVIALLCDMILMHFLEHLYTSTYSITEYISMLQNSLVSAVLYLVLALGILEVAGVVDISHGERNLKFRYEQIKQELLAPSWEERYVQTHAGSVLSCCISLLYMLRAPFQSSWPYVLWALTCKCVEVLLNLSLAYFVTQWKGLALILGAAEPGSSIWVNSFLFTYLIMGYLCGHLIFHYDESKLRTDFVIIGQIVANMAIILSMVGLIIGLTLVVYVRW